NDWCFRRPGPHPDRRLFLHSGPLHPTTASSPDPLPQTSARERHALLRSQVRETRTFCVTVLERDVCLDLVQAARMKLLKGKNEDLNGVKLDSFILVLCTDRQVVGLICTKKRFHLNSPRGSSSPVYERKTAL